MSAHDPARHRQRGWKSGGRVGRGKGGGKDVRLKDG